MGAAIDSLGPGLRITRENPLYVVVVLVGVVIGAVVGAVLGFIPLIGPIVNSVLVSPAFTAVLLGMAFAGLVTGDATIGAGFESLKSNYLSLAGAYALFMAGILGVVVVVIVVPAVVGTFVLGIGGAATSAAGTAATGDPEALRGLALASGGLLLVLLFLLVVVGIVVALAFQFFGVAVVVGGESAVSSFRASWAVFRYAPASVVGYSLLRAGIAVASFLVVGVAYAVGMVAADWTVGAVLGVLVAILVLPFTYAFLLAYHVAYYDERMGNRTDAA